MPHSGARCMATPLTQSDPELGPGHSPSRLVHTPAGAPCSIPPQRWDIRVQMKAGAKSQLHLQGPQPQRAVLPQGWVSAGRGDSRRLPQGVGSLSWACWVLVIAVAHPRR